jgi:2,3-bisphosphoglycerate-dependent phosphoglycerate mutase
VHGALQEATLAPRPFWFLRHGETDWNAQGISQGNTDIPLNATGVAQSRAAAEKLRDRGIATIVASPLSRAHATAQCVGETLRLPVALDADLREATFGVQEGQAMSGWYAEWVRGLMTPEGGEPFAALRHRAVTAVNAEAAAGGAGGSARRAVPFAARSHGDRTQHPHLERGTDPLRAAGTECGRLEAESGCLIGRHPTARSTVAAAVSLSAPRAIGWKSPRNAFSA